MRRLGLDKLESRELLAFGALALDGLDLVARTATVGNNETITIGQMQGNLNYAHLQPCVEQENIWKSSVEGNVNQSTRQLVVDPTNPNIVYVGGRITGTAVDPSDPSIESFVSNNDPQAALIGLPLPAVQKVR